MNNAVFFVAVITALIVIHHGEVIKSVPETRIYYAENAEVGKFPFVILMYIKIYGICTGSLIGDKYVLTAAHCLAKFKQTHCKQLGPSKCNVVIMNLYLLGEPGPNVVKIQIKSVKPHEKYNPKTFENDIGIIILDKAIDNKYASVLYLGYPDLDLIGKTVTYLGWDHDRIPDYETEDVKSLLKKNSEFANVTLYLQTAQFIIIDKDKCNKILEELRILPRVIDYIIGNEHIFCVLPKSESSKQPKFFNGDSGSPLLYQLDDGTYIQVAVFFGRVESRVNTTIQIGLANSVAHFAKWIEKNTKGRIKSKIN